MAITFPQCPPSRSRNLKKSSYQILFTKQIVSASEMFLMSLSTASTMGQSLTQKSVSVLMDELK